MARKRKLHQVSIEDDIRYRGPLSYQAFQILGWLCIITAFIVLLLKIGQKADPGSADILGSLITVLTYISSLSLPFLLIANFSKILNNTEEYKKQLLINGGAAFAVFLVINFVFNRYVVSALGKFVTDPREVLPALSDLFRAMQKNGFLKFNIFIDLFLCTLFMYFLNARPKRFFTGKKILLFRLLALLPVAYEILSIVMKAWAATGRIDLPLWSFPLLTVKPPMTFVVFMILAIHIKTRELRFCRHGRTHEEYQAFLQTKRNSLHFSVFLSIIMVIAAIVDFIMLAVLMTTSAGSAEVLTNNANDTENLMEFAKVAIATGFGESIPLLFVAPFVLLFSYTRVPKNKKISMLIPVIGIVIMFILLIEGIYQGLGLFSQQVEPIPLRETIDAISDSLSGI